MERSIKILAMVFLCTFHVWSQVGEIRGKILEKNNLQPLAGVNVVIDETHMGTSTDSEGKFVISKIPVGPYSVKFSFIGFENKIIPDVIVKTNKITYVNTSLNWEMLEGEVITVTAGYFEQPDDAPVSIQTLSNEEVRRSPGAREDVSRMLQNMPGVNPSDDNRNDLVVRGGSPTEVLFTIDNIDIPNPNHFGTQGATGGPNSMVNTEFIENVKFMAGGFTSNYGHKVSGVMDIQLREGNREGYNGKLDMNFGGAGGYFEGPLNNGKGSFLLGAHRSYLDFMESLFDYGGVPIYSNVQGKLVYDLNKNHQFSLLGIGGDDKIKIKDKLEIDDFKTGVIDTVDYSKTDFRSRQLTVGSNLRSFWNKNFYTTINLSHSYHKFYTDVNSFDVIGQHIEGEKELENKIENDEIDTYDNSSVEQISTFKADGYLAIGKQNALSFGTYAKISQFDHQIDYTPMYPEQLNIYGQKPTPFHIKINQTASLKTGGYINFKQRFWEKFVYNLGVRYDYTDMLQESTISPRLNMKYNATEQLTFHGGIGRYFQNPEFIFITSHSSNKEKLTSITCDHFIAGFNYLLTPDTRLTFEVYHKQYTDYPVAADSGYAMISMANSGAGYGINSGFPKLRSWGKGKADGAELMVQKKLTNKLYGLLSYSYSIIKHQARDGINRNGSFDNRQVLNLVMGCRWNKEWEYSLKWRYAGGAPFTPYNRDASIASGEGRLDLNRINDRRYNSYQKLDLRFDNRDYYKFGTLISYCSIGNVFNRKNVLNHYWNKAQNKTAYNYQSGLFIVGGISFEF